MTQVQAALLSDRGLAAAAGSHDKRFEEKAGTLSLMSLATEVLKPKHPAWALSDTASCVLVGW